MAASWLTFHQAATAEHTHTALPVPPHTGTLPNYSLRCASHGYFWGETAPFCSFGDLTSSHPAGSWLQKGKPEQVCQRFKKKKHPAISTLAHPPASVKTASKGIWLIMKTASFHSKTQRASGARVRTTKLVCILEGQEELSHLTSRTSQPIHFHSVTLY